MSPVRVVRNALSAASEFGFSSHQCPISMNEQRPTSSQPTSSCSVLSATTSSEHRRGEQAERGEVVGEAAVAAHVLERVDVHEQRDERDDEQHHHGEAVDLDADGRTRTPPFCEPRDVVDDRRDDRPRVLAFGAERDRRCARARASAAPSPSGVASSTRWIHWTAAPHDEHERRADRDDADLGALARQPLAEEEDQRRTRPPG